MTLYYKIYNIEQLEDIRRDLINRGPVVKALMTGSYLHSALFDDNGLAKTSCTKLIESVIKTNGHIYFDFNYGTYRTVLKPSDCTVVKFDRDRYNL